MSHPLTEQIIKDLWKDTISSRVNVNEPIDSQVIRAAADWQLEQVLEWLEETECNRYNNVKIIHANDLRAAMRPQKDNS